MTLLAPLHTAQGARLAPPGAPLPVLTHGDVPGEYRAAIEGCALFDRSNLGSLRIEGAEAAGFLNRILAGDVRHLEEGSIERCMLLSPKGKVLHLFELERDASGFTATTPEGGAVALLQALDGYHFGEAITWRDTSSEWAYLELLGPKALEYLAAQWDGPLPTQPNTWSEGALGTHRVHAQAIPVAGRPGLRLRVSHEAVEPVWRSLIASGCTPCGLVAYDSLRAETVWGLWGVDVDDSIYPQEARLEDAFSLTKGCYIGQEVVAKIDTYGGLNKRLMLLTVDSDDPIPAGTRLLQVEAEEIRDLGVVTSWAYSFALDRGVVLAYVKRKHQTPETCFQLGDSGHSATIADLPANGSGPQA
ncbi:MAG: aminomethyl transferase family protein [Planctomycetes bacterium]|nr:aminomethyl transferase family protein [Planctomycetota bacterium]MCB9910732.1 aminomethyl transferase family protein [Planctomycetota bacterium]MCB9912758.1 aminomethyl transferase family protein [Planctomycetota bacterium]HPF15275.1 glycine cleavage T C-terminal barrel domain-containing protein [Planctomycetota bacterium]